MDITLDAERVSVNPSNRGSVTVDIEGVSKENILDHLTIEDVISHFGQDKILDSIGEQEVVEHFDLKVINED